MIEGINQVTKIVHKEPATWEFSIGELFGPITSISKEDRPGDELFNLQGDHRPAQGHHFEIWVVEILDEDEE